MPRKIPLQVLAGLESGIQHLSDEPIHMSKTNGVLLGALKPVHFLHEMYKNAIMTHFLSPYYLTEGDCIGDVAQKCCSLYFTTMTRGMV